ncbi:MAG: hypothetical protein QOC56_299, partial [Alphaproteobacteria bacterium]|nr:hypothetical protein [Alphaproteobacteria bacterium]
ARSAHDLAAMRDEIARRLKQA